MAAFSRYGLLLLCVWLSSCATQTRTAGDPVRARTMTALGYSAVALERTGSKDSRYGVTINVNGVDTRLLVDSGANATKISSETARRAGVRPHRGATAISRGALGKPFKVRQGIGQLSVGEMVIAPFLFSLGNENEGVTAIGRFEGHVGSDGLQLMSAMIDLDSGQMWLPTEDARNIRDGEILPLGFQRGLGVSAQSFDRAKFSTHYILKTTIRGVPMTWVIDTGAEISLLSTAAARRANIRSQRSNVSILDARGDRENIRLGLVPSLEIGNFKAFGLTVGVADLPSLNKFFTDQSGRPVDGILGIDFLRETQCLIDARSRILYIGAPASQRRL